jgi:foldase protein PrsA
MLYSRTMIKKIKLKKAFIIPAIVLAVAAGTMGYGIYKYGFVVEVNGKMISRMSYYNELDRQFKQQGMEKIIQDTLIKQEAAKKNISVSDSEINDEIAKIEERLKSSNMTLEDALKAQGINREMLMEQVRMQKTVDKLVGSDIKIEDKDIDEFLKTNKDMLPKDKSKDELRKMAEEQLKSDKLADAARTWYTGIRKDAKIIYR